jgi:carotenoid cleavage dioxygenase
MGAHGDSLSEVEGAAGDMGEVNTSRPSQEVDASDRRAWRVASGVAGTLYRIGPNPRFRSQAHWFGGDGMVHVFAIDDGRVSYATAGCARPSGVTRIVPGVRYSALAGKLPMRRSGRAAMAAWPIPTSSGTAARCWR